MTVQPSFQRKAVRLWACEVKRLAAKDDFHWRLPGRHSRSSSDVAFPQMTGRKGRVVTNMDGSVSYEARNKQDVPIEVLNVHEKQRFMDGVKVRPHTPTPPREKAYDKGGGGEGGEGGREGGRGQLCLI